MSKFDRKVLKVINRLEAEANYLDNLAYSCIDYSTTKAQQIGTSEGIMLAANILRKQFNFNKKNRIEDESYLLEECA